MKYVMELTERQEELVQAVKTAQMEALGWMALVVLLVLMARLGSRVLSDRREWQDQRERKVRRELMDRMGLKDQPGQTEATGRTEPPVL